MIDLDAPSRAPPRLGVAAALSYAAAWAWAPAFVLWCALVFHAIPLHEPWFDEAQAWLIARDATFGELIARMSYEGTPPLWHLMLVPFAKGGAPYISMQYVGAAFAAAAALFVLLRSPFPLAVRLLLPFGYFGLYQYAIVARSYCVMMPLAFLAAATYPERRERPGVLVAVLILLGATSVQGFLLAAGILATHALEVRETWRDLPPFVQRRQRRALWTFGAFTLLVAVLLCPRLDFGGALPNHQLWPRTLAQVAIWMIDGAFASQRLATAVVLAVSVWWFRRRNVLRLFLLPAAALMLLFLVIRANWWYQGALFLAWAIALWHSFEGAPRDGAARAMTAVAAGLLLAFQIPAAARTLRADAHESYSGSKAAAEYIASHGIDRIFARGFADNAVLPYLSRNPFVNFAVPSAKGYFPWTKRANELQDDAHLAASEAQYVLVSTKFEGRPLPFPGFFVLARFPGNLLWKGIRIETDEYVLLERESPRANRVSRGR